MVAIIILFGALTALAGLAILVNPESVFGILRQHVQSVGLHVLAVAVRVVLGALLLLNADLSRFPLVIEVLGWLSIAAALALAAMGRNNFQKLMGWALSLIGPFGRVGGVLAAAFGGFLIYAFI